VQLLPNGQVHYFDQRHALSRIPQCLIYQSLIIAAGHSCARLENGEHIVIQSHGNAGFSAMLGLQLGKCRNSGYGLGIAEILECGAELDFYWVSKTLAQSKGSENMR